MDHPLSSLPSYIGSQLDFQQGRLEVKVGSRYKKEERMNWEVAIQKVANLLSTHENHQRVLGEMAHEVAQEYGIESLDDFAEDIKEVHGISVSGSTLKNYEFVFRRLKGLDIPDDISYRSRQYIATSGKPEYWAKEIKEKGLSSAEVYRLIREEKGLNKSKIMICPYCEKEILIKE